MKNEVPHRYLITARHQENLQRWTKPEILFVLQFECVLSFLVLQAKIALR